MIGVGLAGCSSTSVVMDDERAADTVQVDYRVIYYIHADADYLYYDSNGTPVRDNKKVLKTAINVAEEAKSGEVFIFSTSGAYFSKTIFSQKKSVLSLCRW